MTPRRTALTIAACALLAGCSLSGPAGDTRTDQEAETIATAISFPRQSSAAGWARAALATNRAEHGNFAVLNTEDFETSDLLEPSAEIVILLHRPETEAGLIRTDALTACYRLTFNHYGVIDRPARTKCPKNAWPRPSSPAAQTRAP